ncbi:MAG: cyclophilin-like fold protein [Acidiferrobacterales bacterium]
MSFQHVFTTALVLIIALVLSRQSIAQSEKDESFLPQVHATMKIHVTANNRITVFELNNSQAAKELYAQLPLSIKVEDYSDNEKIFFPPKKLNTSGSPQVDARAGTLAYYAPWGDVVMFYDNFGSAAGLYELGHAVSGKEYISGMTGIILVEKE